MSKVANKTNDESEKVTSSIKGNSEAKQANATPNGKPGPKVISNPNEVAQLVMMHLDAVNTKKDELTIAIKGLADTSKQLTRAYAGQSEVIAKMAKRIKELEGTEDQAIKGSEHLN